MLTWKCSTQVTREDGTSPLVKGGEKDGALQSHHRPLTSDYASISPCRNQPHLARMLLALKLGWKLRVSAGAQDGEFPSGGPERAASPGPAPEAERSGAGREERRGATWSGCAPAERPEAGGTGKPLRPRDALVVRDAFGTPTWAAKAFSFLCLFSPKFLSPLSCLDPQHSPANNSVYILYNSNFMPYNATRSNGYVWRVAREYECVRQNATFPTCPFS
ncbi:uncharacterized protein LOC120322843 [Pipra filicauda]|uniref:Uncharacterized protein LOC120322843 n=1 Tax=Pipra filicauda TaxID=649802 RepID=A0A7R5KC00_9PASS|nr:uncharacterized protein LOC120322843 [Pipra filicauda]XP_039235113.1 uncharacterized protein LOC120322843 [Pipra filicauda]